MIVYTIISPYAAHQSIPGYPGISTLILDDVQVGSTTAYLDITNHLDTDKPTAVRHLDLSNNHIGMIKGSLVCRFR